MSHVLWKCLTYISTRSTGREREGERREGGREGGRKEVVREGGREGGRKEVVRGEREGRRKGWREGEERRKCSYMKKLQELL